MNMITGTKETQLMEAANLLMDARRTGSPFPDLPADLQPATLGEAYFVQDILANAYGEIGGWKIGAPTPEATPLFGPMPLAWIADGNPSLSGVRYKGLEAEIAFQLAQDLPPQDEAYTLEEVVQAIGSCHPAIEVIDSGLLDPTQAARMSMIADLQMHGGFVYGAPCTEWKKIDFTKETVTLSVDSVVRVERTGSNTSGDLMRLLPWLANEGAKRTGGLKAGQWITTGSWTGVTLGTDNSSVQVRFGTAGQVALRFA